MRFTKYSMRGGGASGFALIVALMLMGFMLLLLLSMSALTRVETQTESAYRQHIEARQNALLALNIALGQLQQYVGADQRTTARADLADASNPNDALRNQPKEGLGRWVSAWGNGVVGDYGKKPSELVSQVNADSGSINRPVLLNWLVSGNENGSLIHGAGGAILSASAPVYSPASATVSFSGESAPDAVNSNATINGVRAQILVGPGSVVARDDYVLAPTVEIRSGEGAEGTVIGRYAYWVGDEGTKARVNLRDNYLQQAGSAQDEAKAYSFVVSQRSGIGMIDGADGSPIGKDGQSLRTYDFTPILAMSQLSVAAGTDAVLARLKDAVPYRFHDITVTSYGVLSDSYAGGLKKEITSAINASTPANSEPLFTVQNNDDYGVPTWGHLRSYYSNSTAEITLPSATRGGVSHVISYAALGFSAYRDEIDDTIKLQMFPILILWNPYNATLPAKTYELGFRVRESAAIDLKIDGQTKSSVNLSTGAIGSSPGGGFFRFKVAVDEMPAGVSYIYRIPSADSGVDYASIPELKRAPVTPVNFSYSIANTDIDTSTYGSDLADRKFTMVISPADMSGFGFDIVLAEPGDGNLIDEDFWYQIVSDVRLHQGNGGDIAIKTIPKNTGLVVDDVSLDSDVFNAATMLPGVAFRVMLSMQGRGENSLGGHFMYSRWLTQSNPRAPASVRTSYEGTWRNQGNISYGGVLCNGDFRNSSSSEVRSGFMPIGLSRTVDAGRVNAGRAHAADATTATTWDDAKFFDIRPASAPFLSLGQLQQAPLSRIDAYPAYALGNSAADFRLGGDGGRSRGSTYALNKVSRPGARDYTSTYYDISWHLNHALWDRYFVSGVPTEWTQEKINAKTPLPNARMVYRPSGGASATVSNLVPTAGGDAYTQAAANLLVAGSFNVNSTSVQAWKAVLTGGKGLPYGGSEMNMATPRFSGNSDSMRARDTNASSGANMPDNYVGNRELLLRPVGNNLSGGPQSLDAVASELAIRIVDEVKARGPFLSLSDFVNRRLSNDVNGLKGALQAAIDNTYNKSTGDRSRSVNLALNSVTLASGDWISGSGYDLDAWRGDDEYYNGAPHQTRAGAINKHLTQADLLSVVAPFISARSDTFVIRAYGESLNAHNESPEGRAWCEVVVQRIPEYVDHEANSAVAAVAELNAVNLNLGRRFVVVSFRWLEPSEI